MIFCWVYVSSSPFLWLLFQWLRSIIMNRSQKGENVAGLDNINDIRNGVFGSNVIHRALGKHRLALKFVRLLVLSYV